jgi:hypothetical protein
MSSPNKPVIDDDLIVRYLLGALPDEDAERLDRSSIVDDDFALRLTAVESDMVDSYVRGELSPETRNRVESFYLASPARREKVRFAEELLRWEKAAGQSAPSPVKAQRRSWLAFPVPLRWGFVCLAVLLCVGVYFLASRSPSQMALSPRPASHPVSKSSEPPPVSPIAKVPLPSPGLNTAFFVLPAPTRDGGRTPVVVPAGTIRVVFELQLEDSAFPSYSAALKTSASDEVLWRGNAISPTAGRDNQAVPITLPANLLKTGNYILDLSGISASNSAELIGSYAFRLVNR